MTANVAVLSADRLRLDLLVHALASAGHRVCVAGAETAELLMGAGAQTAQVAVVDLPLEAADDRLLVRLLGSGVRVIVVAEQFSNADVAKALLHGASDFLPLASASPGQLARAVEMVVGGESALHPMAAQALLEQWRRLRRQEPEARELALTEREQQILDGLAEGSAGKQLAKRLGISEKTVESHKSRLYGKLGVRTQAEAVSEAHRRGLLGPAVDR